ncbi:MAG: hypothetical protein WCJ52_11350, partial [Phenylobacterium sp.]|uniref:hypothetical protein n=1 Tax=Phenylobacterium sp. TaxID=1871053 RepID=UPI003016CCD7
MKLTKEGERYREASGTEPDKAKTYYRYRKSLGFEVMDIKFVATSRTVINAESRPSLLAHERDGERLRISGSLRYGWSRSLGFISEDGVRSYEGELVLQVHDDEEKLGGFLSHFRARENEADMIFLVINLSRERVNWLWARWLERSSVMMGLEIEFEGWRNSFEEQFYAFDDPQTIYLEPQKPHEYEGGRTDLLSFEFTVQPVDEFTAQPIEPMDSSKP